MILLDAVLLDIGETGVASPVNCPRYVSFLLAVAPSKPVILDGLNVPKVCHLSQYLRAIHMSNAVCAPGCGGVILKYIFREPCPLSLSFCRVLTPQEVEPGESVGSRR